jgi:glycosyltransferase involved in cell wall biosynthesis
MGQLRAIKGHDTLIRAFARLGQLTERSVRLRIAGTGGLREYLQGIIDSEGVSETCRLVGAIPRDEVAVFMNDCDYFICSSRTEMLSCVLHECAACGRPAIGTMCGGPQDIITDQSGVLVPVDDVETMAQAMLAMLDRAADYDREEIRRSIIERFGRDTVCDRILTACADAIAIASREEKGV